MSANDQARILGAKACLEVLRRLEEDCPDSFEGHIATRGAAIAAILATAGDISPRAAGAMSVLAELVASERQDGSIYFIERWEPEATMTASEVAKYRAEWKAAYWCDGEAPAKFDKAREATP